MGLDNIPKNYPCKTRGTAVMVQRTDRDDNPLTEEDGTPIMSISCDETQACGGCPYKNAYDKSGLTGGAVLGMFGTDCWYRGKYGNYLLEELGYGHHDDTSFYGDNEDGTEKSPASCVSLADLIQDIIHEDSDTLGHIMLDNQDVVPDLKYAEWYLRWVADECDGLVCWY